LCQLRALPLRIWRDCGRRVTGAELRSSRRQHVPSLPVARLSGRLWCRNGGVSCGVGPEEVVLPKWIRGVEVASNRAKRRFCPHRYCLEGINAATIRTVPRANRYIVPGRVYHLTHRCHDRQFLFKFARDRDRYRRLLWSTLRASPTSVFAYCITSEERSKSFVQSTKS
jgi:hypothetical protein